MAYPQKRQNPAVRRRAGDRTAAPQSVRAKHSNKARLTDPFSPQMAAARRLQQPEQAAAGRKVAPGEGRKPRRAQGSTPVSRKPQNLSPAQGTPLKAGNAGGRPLKDGPQSAEDRSKKRALKLGLTLMFALIICGLLVACLDLWTTLVKQRSGAELSPTSQSETRVETTTQTERVSTKKAKPSRSHKASQTSKKTKARNEASTYDLHGEFDPGDLKAYAGKTYPVSSLPEGGSAVSGLSPLLQSFLSSRGLAQAKVSIIYTDLNAGQRYCYQPDLRYTAASVIKLPMAMVCEQLISEGVFPEDMKIVFAPSEYFSFDSSNPAQIGQPVPLQNLLASAIMYSDNSATSAVFGYFHRHGRNLHDFMDERIGTHYAGDITMSAREGIQAIEGIYFNPAGIAGYQTILDNLSAASWTSFLSGGMPVQVAHKYGNIGAFNHEVGLVLSGHPFAYSVFTEGINAYTVLPQLGALLYAYANGLNPDELIAKLPAPSVPAAPVETEAAVSEASESENSPGAALPTNAENDSPWGRPYSTASPLQIVDPVIPGNSPVPGFPVAP